MRSPSPYRVPGERPAALEVAAAPVVARAPIIDDDEDLVVPACENDAFQEHVPQVSFGKIIFLTALAIAAVALFLAVCQR